jgi:hypothetical protein
MGDGSRDWVKGDCFPGNAPAGPHDGVAFGTDLWSAISPTIMDDGSRVWIKGDCFPGNAPAGPHDGVAFGTDLWIRTDFQLNERRK